MGQSRFFFFRSSNQSSTGNLRCHVFQRNDGKQFFFCGSAQSVRLSFDLPEDTVAIIRSFGNVDLTGVTELKDSVAISHADLY